MNVTVPFIKFSVVTLALVPQHNVTNLNILFHICATVAQ